MFITRRGIVFGGSPTDDSFEINPKPSEFHKIKSDWDQHIPDVWEYDIEKAKSELTKRIYKECDNKLDSIINQWPKNEMSSWNNQASQATSWNSLSEQDKIANIENPDYLLIFNIATNNNIITEQDIPLVNTLVSRILFNKFAYEAFAGKMIGIKRTLKKQVDDATTEEQLNSINITFE